MATFCRLIDWLQKHVNVLTKICVVPLGPARRKRSEAGRMPEPRAKHKQQVTPLMAAYGTQ